MLAEESDLNISAVSYKPLFITLAEKEVSLNSLVENGIISSKTQAKLKKNVNVSIATVVKICAYLDVPIEKVVEVRRT